MSQFGRKFDEALDRHITGNYGEDQFKNEEEKCDFCGSILSEEMFSVFKEIDDGPCNCSVVKSILKLRRIIKDIDNEILDLINEKTDDGCFSDVSREDLVNLRLVLKED